MTAAERKSDVKLTTDIPYPTLTGELWSVKFRDEIDCVIKAPLCNFYYLREE